MSQRFLQIKMNLPAVYLRDHFFKDILQNYRVIYLRHKLIVPLCQFLRSPNKLLRDMLVSQQAFNW